MLEENESVIQEKVMTNKAAITPSSGVTGPIETTLNISIGAIGGERHGAAEHGETGQESATSRGAARPARGGRGAKIV